MRKVFLVFAASLLALGAQAQDQKTVWSLDPAHSSVGFSVRHMMVSNVRGEFTQFSVSVTTVADKPETPRWR